MKNNILVFGSCRLNFKLNNYKLNRPSNLGSIHNHIELLTILELFKNNNCNTKYLSEYSKILNLDKQTLFEQIDKSDIILLEICSKKTHYEFHTCDGNENKFISRIYEYMDEHKNKATNEYITTANTSQPRNLNIYSYFFRKDNIIFINNILYNIIKIGNFIKNQKFTKLNYNEINKDTNIKISNMPNDCFNTFSISFDITNLSNHKIDTYTIKMNISHNSNKDIFIKYYDGTKYIYTNNKINNKINNKTNNNITLNVKYNSSVMKGNFRMVLVGFYIKNSNDEIMTSDMLKKINEFNWNITFNIKSFEIILNNYKNINNLLPKKMIIIREADKNFINNLKKLSSFFINKKIVILHNLVIKKNDNKIISDKVNNSRLEYIKFIKEQITELPNFYFFENYVTNNLISDQNHYNDIGYKITGEKLESFISQI